MAISKTSVSLQRFGGGLNVVDPQFELKAGVALTLDNYDCVIGGGYRRVDGYERFDGRAQKPSTATYYRIDFISGGNTPIVAGDTVKLTVTLGGASTAEGVVLIDPILSSGDWDDGDAAGVMHIRLTTGSVTPGPVSFYIKVGVINDLGTATKIYAEALDDPGYKAAKVAIMDYYRGLIQAVPGSGPIRGVVTLNGTTYAFRNNAGGTATDIYKATTGGWTQVTLLKTVAFTAGSGSVADGQTLTKGANSATIKRVMKTSGSFTGGDAAGILVVTAPAPGSFSAGAATTSGGGTLNLSGAESAIALSPGGEYEFVVANMGGSASTRRIYGCDGVNYAFELDVNGDVYAPFGTSIIPGLPAGMDKPSHICVHKNFLFLSYASSVIVSSALGQYVWNVILGSGELAVGDTITNIYSVRSDVMAIGTNNTISLLYGSSGSGASPWNIKKLTDTMGMNAGTIAEVNGRVLYHDTKGVYALDATQNFGDFATAALSKNIKPYFDPTVRTPKFAITLKDKSHYRVYYSDKTVICATIYGASVIGWSRHKLAHQFTCAFVGEDAIGNEITYAGDDNGYVHVLNSGPNHDGTAIQSVLAPVFSYLGAPSTKKRFRKLGFEMDASGTVTFNVGGEYDYGGTLNYSGTLDTPPSGGTWGSVTWNNFFWSSQVVSNPSTPIDGVGINFRPILSHSDDVDLPFTVQAYLVHYSAWGMKRG